MARPSALTASPPPEAKAYGKAIDLKAGVKANGAGWAHSINRMMRAQRQVVRGAGPLPVQTDLLAVATQPDHSPDVPLDSANSTRFSDATAESIVRQGVKATLLTELAVASGIDPKLLYEFAGIDRSTVARKTARQASLPHEAAVKALEFAELVANATDVFGTVPAAARWLTLHHPMLDGQSPLQRARTPWGLQRVQAMLGALKYGGVV